MEKIIIDNISYYDAESIKKISPIFFKGCQNVRQIIKRKAINDENFIYGICKNSKWQKTDGSSKKTDKLLLLVDWVKENIPELSENKNIKHDIDQAPDIIDLPDDDKMKDDGDNIVEIEIRGKLECNSRYFRVKDVMKAFDIKTLNDILVDKHTEYKLFTDYIYFNIVDTDKFGQIIVKKELFLTYVGLLRVFYTLYSGKADEIEKWAVNIIFVA